eukprot:GFUD01115109.1.p1 GENE.GFUD01115109.1~~GFUD01115109.1.p1  ORF type:complete len:132 (-),score=18.43 GFUD01115109.1:57-452(-)
MSDPNPPNNIMSDIVSQTSLVPSMVEKYRCMVVWDTRTNSDVGWLVVRKPEVEGLTSEEVKTKMSKSQWRSWNQNKSEEQRQMDDSRISTPPYYPVDCIVSSVLLCICSTLTRLVRGLGSAPSRALWGHLP